ncbi:MAG TPA: RagB/SusD family nutrient uptake outer membrane protein [Chitinophagaceae bacterium]
MKMRNTINIVLLLTLLVSAASCKKWLDVSPQTQVRERILFESEQGFKEALTGVYIYLGNASVYGQNLTMGMLDVMAQRYATTATSHTFYRDGRYEYNDANVKGRIAAIWNGMYTAVSNLNNILLQVDEKQALFTGNNYKLVKGEALALRGLIHFDLVRLFGVAPIVDGNLKSIPYPTTFGVSVYPLLTVNQVLDSCMKDLAEAEPLLSVDKTVRKDYATDPFLSYTRNRMNYWAVKGLQARLWLYRGDKPKALAAAQDVINNGTASFSWVTSTEAARADSRDRLYANEHLFSLSAFKINDYVNAYFKTTTLNGTPLLYTTTANINTLFETTSGGSSDFRYVYLFSSNTYPSGISTSKYWQDFIAQNVGFEYLRNLIPMIRLSEVYYIAAECSPVTADGVAYLNTVRSNRGLAALSTGITDVVLQTELLKEYKKETYAEGQLFFHFKRRNTARVDGSNINMNDATWAFPLPEDEIEFANRF